MEDDTPQEKMPVRNDEPLCTPAAKRERASHNSTGRASTDADADPAERAWEGICNAAHDAIWLTDRDFRITRANRASAQILGKPLDEIIGRTCSQAIYGANRPPEDCPFAQAHRTKNRTRGAVYLQERDVWLDVVADPVLDDKGEVTGILHVAADVTDRKKMKEAMCESEERYEDLFENAREAILLTDLNGTIPGVNRLVEDYGFPRDKLIGKGLFDFVAENDRAREYLDIAGAILMVLDPQGRVRLINRKGCEILGYREEEVVGKNWIEHFVPQSLREEVTGVFRRIMRGESVSFDRGSTPVVTRTGPQRLIAWHHAVQRDDTGEIVALLSSGAEVTDYQQAQEALRRSEERYRGIFENAVLGMYQTTPDGEILMANPALVRMLRYETFEELAARNLEEEGFALGHSRAPFMAQMETKGRVVGLESAWKRRDGSTLWVRESVRTVRDETGKTLFYEGTVEDITDRTHADRLMQTLAQERLRQQTELLKNVISNIPHFVFWKDRNSVFLGCNEVFAQSTGLENPDDIVGKTDDDLVWKENADSYRQYDRRVMESGEPLLNFEESQTRQDGSQITLLTSKVPLHDASGRVVGILGIYTDITERKQAEDALRESETKYRELFENAREAIVICNLDKIITDVNKFVETHGFRKEDLIGRNYIEFVAEPYRKKASEDFELLREGIPLEGEFEVMTPKGQVIVYYKHCPIVRGGNVVGVQSIMTDITVRKRAEQQLLNYQNKLRKLGAELTLAEERERRRIAVGVHDQIGQRLALAKLALQSLQASTEEADTSRIVEGVCQDIDKVLEDTHSLTFELSNPILYEVGFEPAVESWLLEQVQDRHGIECTFEADENPAELGKETRVVLFDIVRELLTNVIKHAQAKQVDVRIRRIDGTVQVSVQDDGIGFQPPRSGAYVSESGGFGLFNIREKLDYLGGSITIESAPGEGTCIVVVVPLTYPRNSGK
jgi:PAS domain S-box-containing protein